MPIWRTTPTPSLPGTAGNGGFMGYLPSMVLMSEGLIGACNKHADHWCSLQLQYGVLRVIVG